ncbi:MAG: hypothetical protein MSIBF_06500 [Candidatus Altiarchaeales archaeon IMC4]|nr:MAG: hypothetical protein MSIBF_06500 [Candidatus Altiarchaeales archaeon IMC4]
MCKVSNAIAKSKPAFQRQCLICKGGRLLCGLPSCPILDKINIQVPCQEKLSESMFGPAPSIFVGWKNYPDVFTGPMAALSPENAQVLDDPGKWYGAGFADIIRMRSLLVRTKIKQNVRAKTKIIEDSQEIALAVNPTDVEIDFVKKPAYSLGFSTMSQPMGASGILKKLRLAENPKIPKGVDYVVSDDLNSTDAVSKLRDMGFDVYYLTNVLASGVLGADERKKLVPTRWSITAIDDMLAKVLMERVRQYPQINEFMVYTNTYLENHFEVLLIPGNWEFEQFEAWAPKTLWTMANDQPVIQQDGEGFEGRTDYAINEGGGYYAGRFAAAEAMDRMGRQARVVIFREIYETYIMPVGVWEVRENVRHAFMNKPKKFAALDEALKDIGSRLRIPTDEYVKRSEVLRQKRLSDYF